MEWMNNEPVVAKTLFTFVISVSAIVGITGLVLANRGGSYPSVVANTSQIKDSVWANTRAMPIPQR